MDDYIRREAAEQLICELCERPGCRLLSLKDCDSIDRLNTIPAADVRPVVQREAVMQALNKYFSIGDSYTYELTRVKEAFYVGTMTLDDFEEWNEDNVSDLCDYLMKEIFCPNCGADMREDKNGKRGEKDGG